MRESSNAGNPNVLAGAREVQCLSQSFRDEGC